VFGSRSLLYVRRRFVCAWNAASLPLQPFGEQHHGLAIDLCVIPLPHYLKVLRAFPNKRRASAPAVDSQQVGGRGQRIRHAVAEIDMAVAVVIDSVLDIGGRQELGLADLAA
jgi:hypothetical protein